MMIFGNFENKNYTDQKYHFVMDVDVTSSNSVLIDTESEQFKNLSVIDGVYNLEITKNEKTVYNFGDATIGCLYPVEILARIENNENWNITIKEVYSNDNIEYMEFLSAVEDVIFYEYELDFDIESLDDLLFSNSETIQEYFNDMLYYYCLNENSFIKTWNNVKIELTRNDPTTKNYIYAGTFIDDTDLLQTIETVKKINQ